MPFSIRHRNDAVPKLRPLEGLTVWRETGVESLAAAQARPAAEMRARLGAGHRAYLARLHGQVAAWGWVATRTATIGELGVRFSVPRAERYLWNFATHEAFRGRGIYPRLLQEIVAVESSEAERLWIIHAPENRASGSGIRKAGFTTAGEISFDARARPAINAVSDRAADAPVVLGLPVVPDRLAPCWRCASAGRSWVMLCAPGSCACDYQDPGRGCGA